MKRLNLLSIFAALLSMTLVSFSLVSAVTCKAKTRVAPGALEDRVCNTPIQMTDCQRWCQWCVLDEDSIPSLVQGCD